MELNHTIALEATFPLIALPLTIACDWVTWESLTLFHLWRAYERRWQRLFHLEWSSVFIKWFIPFDKYFFFFSFIFISWRLITLKYCSGFCHTLTWISHAFTCIPHPDPPSHLPPHPILLGLPIAPALSTCLMHLTWAGDLFHPW